MALVSMFNRKIAVRAGDVTSGPLSAFKYLQLIRQRGAARGVLLPVGFDRIAQMRFGDAVLPPFERVENYYTSQSAERRLIGSIGGVIFSRQMIENLAGGAGNQLQLLGRVKEGIRINIQRDAGSHGGAALVSSVNRDDYYNVVLGVKGSKFIAHLIGRKSMAVNSKGAALDLTPHEIKLIINHTGLSVPDREIGVKLAVQLRILLVNGGLRAIYVEEENGQPGIVGLDGSYQPLAGNNPKTDSGVLLLDKYDSVNRQFA
jgi:hypothetical protein